jgi:hypothetical protein
MKWLWYKFTKNTIFFCCLILWDPGILTFISLFSGKRKQYFFQLTDVWKVSRLKDVWISADVWKVSRPKDFYWLTLQYSKRLEDFYGKLSPEIFLFTIEDWRKINLWIYPHPFKSHLPIVNCQDDYDHLNMTLDFNAVSFTHRKISPSEDLETICIC